MATIKKILSSKTEEPKEKKSNSSMRDFLKSAIHYNEVIPQEIIISSGSLTLDSEIKIRSGMIVRLVGKGAELGKTAQGFVFMENYMKTMPKAKGLYVKAEGRLSKAKLEKSGLKFVYDVESWVEGTVFVLCSNIAEPIFDLLKANLKECHDNSEHLVWMIDSMDGLILKDDFTEKSISNNGMVAGVPKLTKLLFRHIALPNAHYDALGILTGQFAAQIKLDQYSPTSPNQGSSSGGSAQQHQADVVFDYQAVNKSDLILEDEKSQPDKLKNKVLGKFARITIRKSADESTFYTFMVPIRFGAEFKGSKQIWVEKEVADLIIAFEMARKPSGSWFTFSADIIEEAKTKEIEIPEKVQGMNGIYKLLEEPKVYEFFAAKIKEMISDE